MLVCSSHTFFYWFILCQAHTSFVNSFHCSCRSGSKLYCARDFYGIYIASSLLWSTRMTIWPWTLTRWKAWVFFPITEINIKKSDAVGVIDGLEAVFCTIFLDTLLTSQRRLSDAFSPEFWRFLRYFTGSPDSIQESRYYIGSSPLLDYGFLCTDPIYEEFETNC